MLYIHLFTTYIPVRVPILWKYWDGCMVGMAEIISQSCVDVTNVELNLTDRPPRRVNNRTGKPWFYNMFVHL